jgi:hypothetical protein
MGDQAWPWASPGTMDTTARGLRSVGVTQPSQMPLFNDTVCLLGTALTVPTCELGVRRARGRTGEVACSQGLRWADEWE